jgi:hypothetical protein
LRAILNQLYFCLDFLRCGCTCCDRDKNGCSLFVGLR